MSENLAGVYDGLENLNGRVNKLTDETQWAFGMFYQMIMTYLQRNLPPAISQNLAPEKSQAGLARETEERITAQEQATKC